MGVKKIGSVACRTRFFTTFFLSFLPFPQSTLVCCPKIGSHWTGISSLDFSDELMDNKKFINLVEKVIHLRQDIAINKFHLSSLNRLKASCFSAWVSYALSRHVADIFLKVNELEGGSRFLVLPSAIFTCELLSVTHDEHYDSHQSVSISISNSCTFLDYKAKLSASIRLSRLRVLDLDYIKISFDQLILEVSFSFPVLDQLYLIDCFWVNVKTLTFFAPALRSFTLWTLDEGTDAADIIELKLYAESLKYLDVKDLSCKLSLYDLVALDEAKIRLLCADIEHRTSNIFEAISSVSELTLGDITIRNLRPVNLLSLTNLKILTIDSMFSCLYGGLLVEFLCSLPGIESLHIDGGLDSDVDDDSDDDDSDDDGGYSWMRGTNATPNLSNLKSVEITCFSGNGNELGLVKFLLKNARSLKKIAITLSTILSPEKYTEISKQLQMLLSGSTCSIHLT